MRTVAITCSRYPGENGRSPQLSIAEDYYSSIARAGGLPCMLWEQDEQQARQTARMFDALLLTGGADIDPALFGEEPHEKTYGIDAVRDATELNLFRAFYDFGKPILGICRGIQLMNTALGGALWQDIPSQLGEPHGPDTYHDVSIEGGSMLHELYAEGLSVNSFHHQCIKTPGRGLRITARTESGIVEAVEDAEHRLIGVQWHPERMLARDGREDCLRLFERFLRL